jgi:endonuclease YncB( thermonuclease family)
LATEILRNGWAKIKEGKGRDREGVSEEESKKREVESQARSAGKGVWSEEEAPSVSGVYNDEVA